MAILSRMSLSTDVDFVEVDDDPELFPHDIRAGSLISYVIEDHSQAQVPMLYYKRTDGSDTNVIPITLRDNYNAIADPAGNAVNAGRIDASTDDTSLGFRCGSKIYNTVNGTLWSCVVCTVGAAVWFKIGE